MADTWFLPDWPLAGNSMMWVGLLLIAGLLGGELVQRLVRLPRIVGYSLVGLALGGGGIGLLDGAALEQLQVFVDISIGLILFELGQRLDLRWLRNTPSFLLMGVAEALGGAIFVFLTLRFAFDFAVLPAALAGAITAATSPAVLMRVAADLRAQGQVTERALLLVALNSVLAFVILTVIMPWAHAANQGSAWLVLVHPGYLLVVSIALALAAALVTLRIVALVGKNFERQFVVVIGMVVLMVGLATLFEASVLLALLAFGAMVRNFDREHRFMAVESGRAGQLFYVILFVVTGAGLSFGVLVVAGWVAIAIVLARAIGTTLGVFSLAPLVGLSWRHAGLLSLALLPMSGMAVIMLHETGSLFPQMHDSIAPAVLGAVLILELIGPVAAQFALRRAGEAASEAAS
jgi:Kef-type K+ transport system membrane component KefB